MASPASGLTRRRGGGVGGGAQAEDGTRVASPGPKRNEEGRGPETSYESSENGHKIAFDPRDMSESAERSKQPKLTLMEEVLLMGLKDKQVRLGLVFLGGVWEEGGVLWDEGEECGRVHEHEADYGLHRAICRSGTTTSRTHCAAASCWSWPSAGA